MAFNLPVGVNYADGITPLRSQPSIAFEAPTGQPLIVGTPLPSASLFIQNSHGDGVLEVQEPPGSPEIERAEQCTCSHTLEMSYSQALFYWSQMGRGTIVTDTAGNVWRMLSCKVKNLSATRGELLYVMESISFDSPPDDFQINEVSLDLNIIKHPRYAWALSPYQTDSSTYTMVGDTQIYYTQIKEAIIRMIQNYIDSPFYPSETQIQGLIQSNILSLIGHGTYQTHYPNPKYDPSKATASPVSWDGFNATMPTSNCVYFAIGVKVDLTNPQDPITIALSAAKELISKLWRQEDTPYIAGYEVVWTQYFFQPVYLNPGGYIEDPRDWVPDYFLNPDSVQGIPRGAQGFKGPVGSDSGMGYNGDGLNSDAPGIGGNTIFDYLAQINPQCYSVDGTPNGQLALSCLRKSDHYEYERTWFKVTHSWLCAPIGKWDSDIYTQGDRPQDANGYNNLNSFFGQ